MAMRRPVRTPRTKSHRTRTRRPSLPGAARPPVRAAKRSGSKAIRGKILAALRLYRLGDLSADRVAGLSLFSPREQLRHLWTPYLTNRTGERRLSASRRVATKPRESGRRAAGRAFPRGAWEREGNAGG